MKSVVCLAIVCVAVALVSCRRAPSRVLRVCADPNNLPFSNRAGEGFENKIAAVLARDRHATLEYTWWAQRRGFVRRTLDAHACDVVIGVPTRYDAMLTTRPYYRSSYVFVARRDRHARFASFDDPRLRRMTIGVQMIGDDFNNTPPAHALTSRGLVRNIVGYPVYGDYARPAPLSPIVDAVDRGDIDVAVVWGPTAGYFARADAGRLEVTPVSPQMDDPSLPFAFDISMGVRRDDTRLRDELDDFIARRHADLDTILADYGVPRVDRAAEGR